MIILISGKQGSGKTTLSKNLQLAAEAAGIPVVPVKFADVLYELHAVIWDVMHKYGEQLTAKKDGPLLQLLGTEWGRNTRGEDIWVRIARRRAERAIAADPRTLVIIDDCRFPNEFDAFDNALTVRLELDAETRKVRCEAWRDNEHHASETGLDSYIGKFDLVYKTDTISSEEIAKAILARSAV